MGNSEFTPKFPTFKGGHMIGAHEIAPLSTPDPLVRGLPEPGVDDDADMYVLKVPSLRNVAMTPR